MACSDGMRRRCAGPAVVLVIEFVATLLLLAHAP
jgi:hypothetical protein